MGYRHKPVTVSVRLNSETVASWELDIDEARSALKLLSAAVAVAEGPGGDYAADLVRDWDIGTLKVEASGGHE